MVGFWAEGFRIKGLRVGFRFRVQGLRVRVWSLGCRVSSARVSMVDVVTSMSLVSVSRERSLSHTFFLSVSLCLCVSVSLCLCVSLSRCLSRVWV